MVFSSRISNFSSKEQPQINGSRLLLSHLRSGDYAHAGDQEAIDLVIAELLKIRPQAIKGPFLDVGCGFGGTANYLHKLYSTPVCGIDLDPKAIKYAKEKYPSIFFTPGDALKASYFFARKYFSLIYLFNSLYSIADKISVLKELAEVAKPDAILTIFDYTTEKPFFNLKDLADQSMHPIALNKLENDLKETGWKLIRVIDLSSDFLRWYQELLKKLDIEKNTLSHKFSNKDLIKVENTFRTIESSLSSSILGGCAIYAARIHS